MIMLLQVSASSSSQLKRLALNIDKMLVKIKVS